MVLRKGPEAPMERVHGNLAGLNVPTLCARMQSLDSVSKLTIVITLRPGIHGRKQVILWIVICGLNHLDRRCSNAYMGRKDEDTPDLDWERDEKADIWISHTRFRHLVSDHMLADCKGAVWLRTQHKTRWWPIWDRYWGLGMWQFLLTYGALVTTTCSLLFVLASPFFASHCVLGTNTNTHCLCRRGIHQFKRAWAFRSK